MFEYMKVLTLRARYECMESGLLPEYLGSTIRGILGHCIHDFFCHYKDKKCFICEERETCLYTKSFSNTGSKEGAVNSYAIYIYGHGKGKWEKGDHCIFDINLFGTGTEYAGVYLDALIAAEQKGWGARRLSFRLLQIVDPYSEKLIYTGGMSLTRNLNPMALSIKGRKAKTVCLIFDTPLRIVSSGELFRKLPFDMLIRFLTRRITLLTNKYTDACLEWDIEEMIARAAAVKTVEESWREVHFTRYSINSQGKKLELASKIGWILYEGDISEFVPVLEAGKYLHIGKGTTIGFGNYEVYYDK
ncbi:MAG: CRISPR system precrRNA processing endoribonuclease RAMP protein Cas6 [Lachnoclostridium sp.]|jgi:hypothetical protein|nr:CRISPR system precrRNA processing endoribonuclease RAMP protein Cas6 [Lachnoclostridium sp.]